MLRSWAQLLRIPNVFTAPPDVLAGAVLTLAGWPEPEYVPHLVQLCLASVCLYLAGMVLNDIFDLEEDRRDRPRRPLPSGRVRLIPAALTGGLLLAVGTGLGVMTPEGSLNPLWPVPVILAALILGYDTWAKRTFLGPVVMGACRGLNVLLGSLLVVGVAPVTAWAAVTVTLYITGVTLFARSEVRQSQRQTLVGGVSFMIVAELSLLIMVIWLRPFPTPRFFLCIALTLALGFVLSSYLLRALASRSPAAVQAAIRACIFGLVALEAIHACIAVGTSGLLLLLFLPPALLLGRWVYST